jgi:small subunit ribosomal protein S20
MRKAIKEVKTLVQDGDIKAAEAALPAAYKAIDKAVKRNIIHQNNAARKKSGLAKLIDQK